MCGKIFHNKALKSWKSCIQGRLLGCLPWHHVRILDLGRCCQRCQRRSCGHFHEDQQLLRRLIYTRPSKWKSCCWRFLLGHVGYHQKWDGWCCWLVYSTMETQNSTMGWWRSLCWQETNLWAKGAGIWACIEIHQNDLTFPLFEAFWHLKCCRFWSVTRRFTAC